MQERDRAATRGVGGGSSWPVVVILAAATALGLALRMYQLTRPGFLNGITEYDDGVYFGSAVRLVHGVIPYRDFVLVQPPGIVLLMAPLALLAKATGTASAFEAARVLTACAGAASVPLAGWLVRRRGPLAVMLACGLLAVYPSGIIAAHTVLLEPWLVLFCLLGTLAAFEGEELTTRPRRLTWAGAAFGFAAAIKVWAVIPAAVLLLVCLQAGSRRWLRYLVGMGAGFGAAVLPFFVLAPGSTYRDVVVAQLTRADVFRTDVWTRLQSLVGLNVVTPASHAAILALAVVFAGFTMICLVGGWLLTRRPPPTLHWFSALSAVLIVGAFLWPPDYYPHYACFFAVFLALALALPAGRFADAFMSAARRPGNRFRRAWLVGLLTLAAATVVAVAATRQFHQLSAARSGHPSPLVRRDVPAGACVLTDLPPVTILADRFVSATPGCSVMVDPLGTSYALSGGRNGLTGSGRIPAVRAAWLAAFGAAEYVWLQCLPWRSNPCLTGRRVAWSGSLRRYFSRHFEPVRGQGPHAELFVRRRS